MAERRRHYERAIEMYLERAGAVFMSVNDSRRAILPVRDLPEISTGSADTSRSLKSFDYAIYAEDRTLLVDIKGRKIPQRKSSGRGRLENWVTRDDVDSLRIWVSLMSEVACSAPPEAWFVFVYWCEEQPRSELFQEITTYRDRWYALRAIPLESYAQSMRVRSSKWGTLDLPHARYEQMSMTLSEAIRHRGGSRPESPEGGSSLPTDAYAPA